ncbi:MULTISPECIES: polyamine ABC transporter substrate-binding protein [Bradyrhizobium]|uniref:polyamine ABC transporter substrate-binding protein n=1 Tax=Bradyrhizobium centrosematis TaxID=1300039 RepID=UPI002169AAF6|nr:polyamine ABC transporter substrate-binding protein [Bradyrhizobium centrosematis]MCS3765885.1 putative spermidine/putrescine transport system substrate-binding protein [Bradyrhizobium centrosematis]MCS3778213.1 putative spermidine/putrescine transport system substrate-binding protein [Bradyrhizobium centrosematis]
MITSALAAIGLAAGALAPMKSAFAADQLTVTHGGGSWAKALRKDAFDPFTKNSGIKITEAEYDFGNAKIRAMVDTNTVIWDVVVVTEAQAKLLCAEGTIEMIDWKKLGLDRTNFQGGDHADCGVPTHFSGNVVAYDKVKLPNGPKTIADFFDLKTFPGKRGLYKSPAVNLEWALMADGVPPKDVYKVLNTPEGLDRAFKKLDTIKKDVVWWTAGAQPQQLLADGQVVISQAWNGRVYDAVKSSGQHFVIMWDGAMVNGNALVIPKGTRHLEDAYKFLAFAGLPRVQADLADDTAYSPANKDAVALIDPAIRPFSNAPADVGEAIPVDATFWTEKGDEIRQRFAGWLGQ